jgi:S-adenosyl methyltransferase
MVAHPTTDIATEGFATPNERLGELLPQPYVARTHAKVARFLEGLDLVEPGLVPIDDWRPPADAPSPRMVMPM